MALTDVVIDEATQFGNDVPLELDQIGLEIGPLQGCERRRVRRDTGSGAMSPGKSLAEYRSFAK